MAEQGEVQEVKTREEEDPLARIEFEDELIATLEKGDVDEITEKLTPRALVRCKTNALCMAMKVNSELRRLADEKGPGEDEFTKMANSVDEFTNCLLEPLKFDTESRLAFGDSLDDIIDTGIESEQKTLFAHPVMYNLMERKWWGIFGEMSRCSWLELSYWAWLVLNVWCLFDIFLFPVLFAVFYIKHRMNLNKSKRKEMDLAFVLNATSNSASDAFALMKESIKYLMGKHNYRRVKYQILIHGEDSCSTEISFSSDFHSMKDLLDSLDHMTRNPDVHIPTLHEDLQKVAGAFEQVENRPNSQKVLVLFTDHRTCLRHEKDEVEKQVETIKEMGIKLVPVGIGPNVDSKELKRINNGRKLLLFGQNANRVDVGKKIWQELHGKDLLESYQEYFTTPYFVFIRDTLSYLALLGLHFALCLEKSSIQFSGLEWAILVFFLGRMLMECRQFLSLKLQPESRMTTKSVKGSKYQICKENERSKTNNQSKADGVFLQRFCKYLSDRWNILDLMTLLIYTVTFFLRVVTWAVSESVTENRALVTSGYLYGLNTMFLTLRAFGQVMETVKSVGVIQIALFHIIGNVATIFLQFIATILAFSIAITKVYMAERSFVSDNTIKEPACKSSDGLACWWTTVKLLTWSLLGIVELDPFDSVDIASVTLIHFLFGAFLIMGVILLVNMMIALLSNTYQRVEDNALKEWSFKKAITIQTYSSYHPIPVPLNLISHVVLCIRCLWQICARKCTGIPRKNTRRIKTRNTSLDKVVENLQRMYIETYGYSFPLTDERKIDHILKETERNRQMANQIAYRTFTSRGVEEDIYSTGPKAWQSKGIRVHGCLLTYEGQSCLQCKDNPVKYHGARYLLPFSPDTPHFEVLIQETGKKRLLAVGVVGNDYGNHAPPGWFKGTVGYHVDDGKIFDAANNEKGVEYGGEAIAHRGDLIGCTVRFDLAKGGKVPVVFTLNGKHITSDEKWIEYTPNKKSSLYPYICMAHTGITVLAKMCMFRKTDEGLKPLKTNGDGRTHENGRIHEDERTHEDGRIQKDDGQLFAEQFDTELAILKALEEMDEDFESSFKEINRDIKIAKKEMVTGQKNFNRLADDILYNFKRFETEIQDDIANKKVYSGIPLLPAVFRTAADRAEAIGLMRLCEEDFREKDTWTNLERIKEKTINLQIMTRANFRAVIMALNQFKMHTTENAQRQTELMEKVMTRFHVHEKFIRTSLPITKDAVLVSTE